MNVALSDCIDAWRVCVTRRAGFRDDSGAVLKLQTLETLKLPGYAARHPGAWDPKTALHFADRLLTWLRQHLDALAPGTRRVALSNGRQSNPHCMRKNQQT